MRPLQSSVGLIVARACRTFCTIPPPVGAGLPAKAVYPSMKMLNEKSPFAGKPAPTRVGVQLEEGSVLDPSSSDSSQSWRKRVKTKDGTHFANSPGRLLHAPNQFG